MQSKSKCLNQIFYLLNAETINTCESYYSSSYFELDKIKIKVTNLGQLNFPISRHTIKNLIDIAYKAKFGLNDKTLLDESIRNTYEITPDNIEIEIDKDTVKNML